MDIIRRLRLGKNFHDIAREFGVTVSSVTEVFRKATGPQLAALFAGLTRDAGAADTLRENPIAPVTLSSPVDVMGVMIRALERTQGVERFLDDPRFWDADTHDDRYRMEQSLKVVTAQINWAEKFVDTRLKVLQLVNIDTWLQELLSMVEAVDLELGRELEALGIPLHRVSLGLKGRLLERIRLKLLGREPATPVPVSIETAAEPESES
jgi:hypothetical protein